MCKVSNFPQTNDESRKAVAQFYWDNSLSQADKDAREEFLENVREEAKKHYAKPSEALTFMANIKAQQ